MWHLLFSQRTSCQEHDPQVTSRLTPYLEFSSVSLNFKFANIGSVWKFITEFLQPSVILLSSSPLLFLVYYTNKYNHRRSIKNLKNMTCDISQSHTYDETEFNMPTMDGIGESLHLWVLVVTCSNWRTFLTVCCDRYADLCSGGKRWQCLSHTSNNLANLWIFLDFLNFFNHPARNVLCSSILHSSALCWMRLRFGLVLRY